MKTLFHITIVFPLLWISMLLNACSKTLSAETIEETQSSQVSAVPNDDTVLQAEPLSQSGSSPNLGPDTSQTSKDRNIFYQSSPWGIVEDPHYGFRFAVPCFWQLNFPEQYYPNQAYAIKNYSAIYPFSFPTDDAGLWESGGIKIDLVIAPRSPRGQTQLEYAAQLYREDSDAKLISTSEMVINNQEALLITTESIFGTGHFYLFNLTEDKFLIFSPSPGALQNPDVRAILQSAAIEPDIDVVMPDFSPGYPIEGAITECMGQNVLEVSMVGPKSVPWGSGKPVKLQFAMRNLTDQPIYILNWLTPLEGIAGNIFQVRRDGQPVLYQGILAARTAPSPDDYLLIEPNGAVFAEVNLSAAYDFSRPGAYTIAYNSPVTSHVAQSTSDFARTLDELGPVFIPSNEITVKIELED